MHNVSERLKDKVTIRTLEKVIESKVIAIEMRDKEIARLKQELLSIRGELQPFIPQPVNGVAMGTYVAEHDNS